MPYIKISDPNIIDLAAWHQVINVVNQHSDSLTAITNNFGVQGTGVVSWNGSSDFAIQYDPGSQKIIYGRTRVDTTSLTQSKIATDEGDIYYGNIPFQSDQSGTTSFGANPIVTATYRTTDPDTNPPTTSNPAPVITVVATTQAQFTYRIFDATGSVSDPGDLTGFFYINWVAIGPK